MKRVRCPKCDNYIVFDETKYSEGQSLVFVCQHCKKEFGIRIGKSKLTDKHEEKNLDENAYNENYGSIVVIENQFAFKQVIPLDFGENEIGRYLKGTNINKPIETRDPSVDTFHCAITVKRNKKGKLQYILRDAPSDTGTFYMNEILKDSDRINLEDGAIITIGATTLILRTAEDKQQ
ncbi:MAG: FHA domain-containing protein [Bacteroidaceae bacterium]|jgi:DNA-directed RNA polymerase subunit M/transcription elongation factor TFIIS|nr:FHA domain-containing protein [Bacteroidaceae bacterium]